jgi:bla regulator protein blaR1
MASELLNILENITAASSCGILLTLLLRRQLRSSFGPSLAYFLWLLVPTSLLVLLLPAPSAGLMAAVPIPLSMPTFTGHVALLSMSSGLKWATWLLCTWGIGALVFCARLARQQRLFVASLGVLISNGGVLHATYPTGCPVVVGIVRPKIVVPSDFHTRYAPEEQGLILAHERMHVRRGDLAINAVWAIARCIFWFNPLIHVAARLIRFDQELACDAAVMRDHPRSRKPYANAMLRTQLADSVLPLGCHWPPTHPLKERIMLLKQPPARGLRRGLGQVLVGTCVLMVGYVTWAVQSDGTPANHTRVRFADSAIRVSSNDVEESGDIVRCTGNVVIEIMGNDVPVTVTSRTASYLDGTAVFKGNVRIDGKLSGDESTRSRMRKDQSLEGKVQIEIDGRIFTTEHAVMSARAFKMDAVDFHRDAFSDAVPVH